MDIIIDRIDLARIVASQSAVSLFPGGPITHSYRDSWAELPADAVNSLRRGGAFSVRLSGEDIPIHRARRVILRYAEAQREGRDVTPDELIADTLYQGYEDTQELAKMLCHGDSKMTVRVRQDLSEHDQVTIDVAYRLRLAGQHEVADGIVKNMRPDSPVGREFQDA